MPFEIVRNDITKMKVDAIVNAANNSLLGGGGVDGAIHRAAGPELLAECRTLVGCETGKAKWTAGYRLPCKGVIHTVGPVWQGGNSGEKELLTSCYRESMELAAEHGCESVAFPLISSGAYGYPKDLALKAATDTILEYLADHDLYVYLVIFDRNAFLITSNLYASIQAFIDDSYAGPYYELEESRRRLYNAPAQPAPQAAAKKAKKASGFFPVFSGRKAEKEESPLQEEPRAKETREEESPDFECLTCAKAPAGLEEFIAQIDEGFRDMLLRKIDERQMTDAECYKKANIDRKLFNKIKNLKEYRPGKTTVLALAVSLRLSLPETREMLDKAGFSLPRSSKADLIVEYFILQGNYNIYEINEALFSFDQKLLGSMTI